MAGWVKLHRDILQHTVYCNSTKEQKVILITLLLLASHAERDWEFNGKRITIRPGQLITGLDDLAKKSGKGITVRNVRTALTRLEAVGFLANEVTNKGRLITVINWDFWQGADKQTDKLAGKQVTSKRQASDKQVTTNKNEENANNEENDKEETTLTASAKPKSPYSEDFNRFWLAYPLHRRKCKGGAYKHWKAAKAAKVLPDIDTLINLLEQAKNSQQWAERNGDYTPGILKYLREHCWEDGHVEYAGEKRPAVHSQKDQEAQDAEDGIAMLRRLQANRLARDGGTLIEAKTNLQLPRPRE